MGDTSVTLGSNDFDLFDVPVRFSQDRSVLDARWKDLQREAHPDRFAAQPGAAQRLAMQWSVRINEAYQRLKDPLRRAAYLCELAGSPINAQNNTAMPTQFLMQQMEWREALAAAVSEAETTRLNRLVQESRHDALVRCEEFIDVQRDYPLAAGQVRALMFIERFSSDIEAHLERLETASRPGTPSLAATSVERQ